MKRCIEFLTICGIIFLFVSLGMLPILSPWIQKPGDRTFNGMHGYLDDYVGYASYVKEGMYGLNTFRIRSLPKDQQPTSANLVYIWAGFVATIFGWDAPTGYHATRAFLGAVFVLTTYVLFRLLLKSHWWALGATSLAFLSSAPAWYIYKNSQWIYTPFSTFSFIDNVAGRVTTRPHYILGAILFLLIIILLLNTRVLKLIREISVKSKAIQQISFISNVRITIVYVLCFFASCLLGITHPSFAILLLLTIGFVSIVRIIPHERYSMFLYITVSFGLICGLGLSKWSTSVEPYVSILSFEEYVYYERLSLTTILSDIKTFGPTLWIGFPTLLFVVIKSRGKATKDLVMFFWLLGHFLLFFSLYSLFRAERFRFIQSLYFIPMAYGTILFFRALGKKFGLWVSIVGFFLLTGIFIPSYIQGFFTDYYALTDYKSWSSLYFPFNNQMEAYRFLDRETPRESVVIASFEAANHIILYSHNYVLGNTQGWPREKQIVMVRDRDNFFSGTMPIGDARKLLLKYDVTYVYNGWQEKTLGDIRRYPFLIKIFDNGVAEIYRVD